jgi:rsbT co-antagonist protein RsbR
MSAMLTRIRDSEAKVFILDISGVAVVDTAVANHLIKMTRAARLLGCECIISGLSPAIAQTIVALDIDVSTIDTRATLKDALASALARIGMRLTRTAES